MKVKSQFETMTYADGRLWFPERRLNGLFSYNLATGQTEEVCKFADEGENTRRLFSVITEKDGFLFLIPINAKCLYEVDRKTKGMKKVSFCEPDVDIYVGYRKDPKFMDSLFYGDSLYITPITYPAIIEYNLKTKAISYHGDWYRELLSYKHNEEGAVLFRKCCIQSENLFLPCVGSNAVMTFSTATKEYGFREIGKAVNCFSAIMPGNDDEFWLAPRRDGAIIKWNSETNVVKEYNDFPSDFEKKRWGIGNIGMIRDRICFLPQTANMLLYVDDAGNIRELEPKLRDCGDVCICHSEKDTFLYSNVSQELYIFSDEKDGFEKREIFLPEERSEEYLERLFHSYRCLHGLEKGWQGQCLHEEYDGALKDYITYDMDMVAQSIYGNENSIGRDIYFRGQ